MKEKIGNTIEKIESTVLRKESQVFDNSEEVEDEPKTLNQRIEDLVNEMEKNTKTVSKVFSLKFSFIRGLLQGLGIIIGSTILAGALYSMSVHLFGEDVLKGYVLENIIEKNKKDS